MIEQQEIGGGDRFVPNDLFLNSTTHTVLVLTGPNMGGKSTYLRQAALTVILAQMGSFVPARSARLGLVDRVFTRIGASDNVARGRSTFMVEMTETAAILHTATARSLILLDEVGRGTSTYDGLAIAWAAVEYIHARMRAKTLFATHYFELTELADQLSGVKNYHVSVKETGGGIVFLRKVEPGAADRSYGIEVAKLAGLPNEVIDRAREVLAEHESAERQADSATGKRRKPSAPAGPTNDLYAALAAGAGETARGGPEPAHPARGSEFAGGIEEADRIKVMARSSKSADLSHQIGQLLIIGFEATEVSAHLGSLLSRLQPSGVILFARNITSPDQTYQLLKNCRAWVSTPMFTCVDMEGGRVDRLKNIIAPAPSAAEVFASGDRRLFRKHGKLIGDSCRTVGFNTDFAPVVDLAYEVSRTVMGSRAVSADPKQAILYAREFLAGLKSADVVGAAKHFPGLGEANLDTHHELPNVDKSWKKLWAEDMVPYRTMRRELPMVLVGHASYPAVTAKGTPASLSKKWITDILRKKIGYRGLVVSDDLGDGRRACRRAHRTSRRRTHPCWRRPLPHLPSGRVRRARS